MVMDIIYDDAKTSCFFWLLPTPPYRKNTDMILSMMIFSIALFSHPLYGL